MGTTVTNRLTVDGEWDSLFSITMPLVYGAQADTLSKVCASLYNAQYWLYRESLDSVAHYLDIVQRNLDSIDGLGMEGMYYVLEGMYRMKVLCSGGYVPYEIGVGLSRNGGDAA